MKRTLVFIMALFLLLGICGAACAADGSVSGKVVIFTSMYKVAYEPLQSAMQEEFPDLEIEFVYGGSGALVNRLLGEMDDDFSGVLSCDMLLVAEPAFSLELKEYGYLEPVEIENPEELLRFEYDPEGYWYPVRVCNMVLAYNPEKTSADELPKTFLEFAQDRSLVELTAMPNPLTSGTALAAIAALSDKYGFEYFTALGKNKVVVESPSATLPKLADGTCKVALMLEESVLNEIAASGASLACLYPEDGTILIPSTVMTIESSKSANGNAEACKAITRWLLSETGQKIIVEKGYMHGVLRGLAEYPAGSVDTGTLLESKIPIDWERCYKDRDDIRDRFQEAVPLP